MPPKKKNKERERKKKLGRLGTFLVHRSRSRYLDCRGAEMPSSLLDFLGLCQGWSRVVQITCSLQCRSCYACTKSFSFSFFLSPSKMNLQCNKNKLKIQRSGIIPLMKPSYCFQQEHSQGKVNLFRMRCNSQWAGMYGKLQNIFIYSS